MTARYRHLFRGLVNDSKTIYNKIAKKSITEIILENKVFLFLLLVYFF